MSETDDQLARRLLGKVLDGSEPWTPDMRLRIATVAQAYASLAIVEELRRSNEDRDRFYSTMREFFEKVTEDPYEAPPPGPCASQTPPITFDGRTMPRLWCNLRHGHAGRHENEGTSWVDEGSSLRSEQPAAAPECPVCGKTSTAKECWQGELTREQWCAHYGAWTRRFLGDGDGLDRAQANAQAEMEDRFGPCPEES